MLLTLVCTGPSDQPKHCLASETTISLPIVVEALFLIVPRNDETNGGGTSSM